ncbi:probable protein phosphatase 2C 42 [Impatiens glandulifera]|uniref:probable protein phosphatase 2C 42 n=1 Tax=Impatiens glandulifera TaxID=253017 RepID=UPI001FB060AE|nr:probable protein phosphatase 2C 42 [Impatiens glandulifera]
MLELLMNLLSLCWRPIEGNALVGNDFSRDGLLWFRDIGKYAAAADFSMAVIQANLVLEDQSQIESGNFGTFVGIYDGHGGPEASRYVCDHLFRNIQEISAGNGGVVNSNTIERAFLETERGFTSSMVDQLWNSRPNMATVGTCCLAGIIFRQTLFVANLGDSRVVLGRKVGNTGGMAAIQLSTEHNVNNAEIRQELKEMHPNDPQVVVLKHGVWRVKGIIQVSRSIGDVYMKDAQYNRAPINQKFRLSEPMDMPYLTATPSILTHPLQPNDSFLIFASDGLWEHLSNETAVDIVHSHPRAGSAKRLVKAALHEAAKKREMRYSDLKKIEKKVRRHFHDDITVIVLFLNHDAAGAQQDQPPVSLRSALEHY